MGCLERGKMPGRFLASHISTTQFLMSKVRDELPFVSREVANDRAES